MSIENVSNGYRYAYFEYTNIVLSAYAIYTECSKSLETVITLIRLIMADQR